jgi:poly(glycerol-phosphate) alpha-glucosyltransferase
MPPGRHFAVTWSIPDDYGGMTSALLHRSRAFVRFGGVRVDVLTFDARPDYPDVEAGLRARGELVDGVGLLNLYDWLRHHQLPGGSLDLERDVFLPLDPVEAFPTAERDGRVLSRDRLTDDGVTILQRDHHRLDGSLLLSDRRDVRERGVRGGRSVVLCDAEGVPVRSWRSVWPLYRAWLDALTAGKRSWMIVDSKTSANFMLGYRRRHVVVAHLLHNSHLADSARPDGPLRESRRRVVEQLARFDAVVVLTERQRADLQAACGEQPSLAVIPNAVEAPRVPGHSRRRATAGVMLASLTRRKRVDVAIRAVAATGIAGLTLDVYGEGDHRAELETLIARLGVSGINLHGYRPDARDRLATASFLLATGSSEGFPLALVEAMAVGCVPIAADVRYGPSDAIRHGVNGLLVAPGDVAALAAAIRRFVDLPETERERMRRAARRAARAYRDAPIVRRWSRELRVAAHRHRSGPPVVLPREDAPSKAPA